MVQSESLLTQLDFEPGEKPVFKWIDKNDIRTDSSAKGYQRKPSESWAEDKVADFKWRSFAAVIVSERNGIYYAIDAGNRLNLALKIPQIKEVPCLVYKHQNREEEAKSFIDINEGRRGLRPLDKYKSRVCAKDKLTLATNATLLKFGMSVSTESSLTAFRCPSDLKELQANGRLESVIKFIEQAWPEDKLRTKSCVVAGVGRFLSRFKKRFGKEAEIPEVVRVFSRFSLVELCQKGRTQALAHETSGKVGFCVAMIDAFNKGRTTNRIPPTKD